MTIQLLKFSFQQQTNFCQGALSTYRPSPGTTSAAPHQWLASCTTSQFRPLPLIPTTSPPKPIPLSRLYVSMRNNRPLHTLNPGRPPPKPTASHHMPPPKLSSTPWFFHQLSPPPTHLSRLPLPPQPLTLLPQQPQRHHPPLPLPFPTSNPTQTQHSGSTPTSSPPHRWTRFPLQQHRPTSRPPLGARPGARAPKHHHAQPPRNALGSAKAALPHMLTSAAALPCRNHAPQPPLNFYLNHPISHQRNHHQPIMHHR